MTSTDQSTNTKLSMDEGTAACLRSHLEDSYNIVITATTTCTFKHLPTEEDIDEANRVRAEEERRKRERALWKISKNKHNSRQGKWHT